MVLADDETQINLIITSFYNQCNISISGTECEIIENLEDLNPGLLDWTSKNGPSRNVIRQFIFEEKTTIL